MKNILRDNGLTIVLVLMFLGSLLGMVLTGQAHFNSNRLEHGLREIGLLDYVQSGEFGSALLENWESEFLQMAVYVVLTAVLFQRGSAESRDPDHPGRLKDNIPPGLPESRSWLSWIYSHSLGLALGLLFAGSFILHWLMSYIQANEEAQIHGAPAVTLLEQLSGTTLWFQSFQNWQSEFMSTAVLVVLSIFLRQRNSSESKPVAAANSETGA